MHSKNSKSSFYDETVIAISISLLLLTAIAGHFRPSHEYNAWVADLLLVFANILLLKSVYGNQNRIGWTASPSWKTLAGSFVFISMLSAALSYEQSMSFARLKVYYSCIFFCLSIFLAIRHRPQRYTIPILTSIATVHAFFFVTSFVIIAGFGPREGATHNTVVPFFSNIRHFGYLGYLGACAGIALALSPTRMYITGFALGSLGLIGIILLGSRGPLVAWIIFAAVVVAISPSRVRVGSLLIAVFLISLFFARVTEAVLSQWNWAPLPDSMFDRGADGSILRTWDRLALWRTAGAEILKSPLIGLGPEAHYLTGCCPGTSHPHNGPIQFLLEFGTIGTALLLAATAKFLLRIGTYLRTAAIGSEACMQVGLLGSIVIGFLAYSLVDGVFYHAIPLTIFTILVAMLIALTSAPYNSSETMSAAVDNNNSK